MADTQLYKSVNWLYETNNTTEKYIHLFSYLTPLINMTTLTNLTKYRPYSEANIFSPTQRNNYILWKLYVYYRIHNIQPFYSI